jgi:diguanylate cyclase (GGDEF)-like protein
MPDPKAQAPSLGPPVGVLIVDDRRENLLALEVVLEPLGQRLVRAQSGQDALRAALLEQFAVILMDVCMPGLDGFEAMALLRKQEGDRHAPIIFISAADQDEHIFRSYSAGAVDYIRKPIDAEALRAKVSVFVHIRQNELALEAAHAELEQRVAERTAQLADANRSLALEIEVRKAAEKRLAELAFRDALTGLANRAQFMSHLKRALARARRRTGEGFAVLMLDVDRFKVVNDSLGHLAGDTLLVRLAERLAGCLREVDTIARLGGDEFAILLDGVTDIRHATRLTERLLRTLELPFAIDGKEVFASSSVGVTLMSSRYTQAEELLRDADAAMYRAKVEGRARFHVFDIEMHANALTQLQLETELRHALERNELCVYYQPMLALADDRIDAFEALVRWRHPARGLIQPAEFIPLAEETGLIRAVGRWVFDTSCRQLATWRQLGFSSLTMSVNLSAREFADPNLSSEIEATARAARVDLSGIELELTETAVMSGRKGPEETLERLAQLGVSICLDDFGTGYSCLSYLHRFPVSTLKVDRSFVGRIGARDGRAEIVHTIVALAQSLGMSVTAEGVETVEQLERLRTLGCNRAQGHYFAEAMDAETAERFLRNHDR